MTQSLPTAALAAAFAAPRSRWLRNAALGLFLAGAATLPARAQLGYSAADVQILAGSYTDLGTGGTAVSMANNDDANSAAQNIGFPFHYAGQNFTQFVMNTNGFIKLGNTAPSAADLYYTDPTTYDGNSVFASQDPADEYFISPFNYDLEPSNQGGGADFRMQTTGTAPNRVTTIQWKNVSDKTLTIPTGTANKQYRRFSFQVKLYETTNKIEFVYDGVTQQAGTAGYRGADVGLSGASGANEYLTSTKGSVTLWNATDFQDMGYDDPALGLNRHNFRKDVSPVSGLTYQFTPQQANDMAVAAIYTLGSLPIPIAAPHSVQAVVINRGFQTRPSVAVQLSVSGATTFTNTQTLTNVAPGDTVIVTFAPYTPLAGNNTLLVSVPNDDNLANNSSAYDQEVVTNGTFSYADNAPASTSYGLNAPGLWLTRYNTPTAQALQAVNIFFGNDAGSVGQTYYAVLTDAQANILARSADYVLTTGDLDSYHSFTFPTQPNIAVGNFYVGFAQTTTAQQFPLGVQDEDPLRPNTFFIRPGLTGAPVDLLGQIPTRLMIQAQLGAPAACQTPATVSIGSVTGTGATVTFAAVAGATGYTVAYGPAGFTPGTGGLTQNTTGTTVTLSGLSATTSYDVYVRANCSPTTSSVYNGPFNFSTPCVAPIISTFPYTENFDATAANQLPCGWTVENLNGDTVVWRVRATTFANSAPNALSIRWTDDAATSQDDWVYSPGVQMAAGQSMDLTFNYRGGDALFTEKLEVKVGTAANAAAMTTQIFNDANINFVTQTPGMGTFTATTAGVYYFGFHAYSDGDQFRIVVDDVNIQPAAACPTPRQLAATSVTSTTATLTFTTGAAGNFTVIYGPQGFNPATGGTSVTNTTGTVNLTSLTPLTAYDFYVVRNCGAAGNSAPAGPVSFTTQCTATTVSTFPYNENFDSLPSPLLQCGVNILDANGDGFTWRVYDQDTVSQFTDDWYARSQPNVMAYLWNAASTADDWFFLPPMQFTAGQPMRATWWHRASATNDGVIFPEVLEVKYGTTPTPAGMTNSLYNRTIRDTVYVQANSSNIAPATSGTYYIGFHVMSAADQYVLQIDDITVDRATGLAASALERAVAVFPNPTAGKASVMISETGSRNVTIRVFDNLGRTVYSAKAADNATKQIDLNHLANGVYTLQVKLDDQVVTKRLSVQK